MMNARKIELLNNIQTYLLCFGQIEFKLKLYKCNRKKEYNGLYMNINRICTYYNYIQHVHNYDSIFYKTRFRFFFQAGLKEQYLPIIPEQRIQVQTNDVIGWYV